MSTSSPASRASREARFRAVYEATYDDLLSFAQRRVHPTHAEDVAADVFLVAWRRLDDMPHQVVDARPWLFGVARATMLNHRRGERRRDALAVRIADVTATDGARGHDELSAHRLDLASAWKRLSAAEQEVISLAVWDGLDSAGAGVVLGCSPTAYRLRLSRARRSLRRHADAATRSSAPPAPASASTPPGPLR